MNDSLLRIGASLKRGTVRASALLRALLNPDHPGALGLVVNALTLWNTLYTQAALDYLSAEGVGLQPEDVARLTPPGYENFNFLGRYSFQLPAPIRQGQLRPLRTEKMAPQSSELAF